jgi:hypothetical protein
MTRLALLCLLAAACNDTTGGALVSFNAVVGGVADVTSPLSFTTARGFDVTLTRAHLHLAAVYLNQSVPSSGAQQSSCVLPGTYVAEAFGPVDVDLLSTATTPLTNGAGTATEARAAEVWLSGGDIDAQVDPTIILDVAGTANTQPFTAQVTISTNRQIPVQNPALPGSNPICHQRIVTPIPVDLTPLDGGTLALLIDPRPMFAGVDFSAVQGGVIPDVAGGVGGQMYKGLMANADVYNFTFQ